MTKATTGGTAKTANAAKKPAAKKAGNTATATDAGSNDVAAAKSFDPSGAPHQVPGVDAGHPALDENPRADTSADDNRIDLNDPSKSGAEAVADNLKKGS